MIPSTGSLAPDFELPSHHGGTVRLASFRGKKNVLVAFHPLAFTPVCERQVKAYEADRDRFDARDTHVLVISVDSVPCKSAWAAALGGVSFDLLSDFHPIGAVARLYGVMRDDGISERAVFLVDKEGRIAWSRVYDIPELPSNEDVLSALVGMT